MLHVTFRRCRPYVEMLNAENEDDEQKAMAERDRISEGKIEDDSIFEPYYAEMKQMIHDEIVSVTSGASISSE